MGSCYLRWARGVVNCENLDCGDIAGLGSARGSRAGFGGAAKRSFLGLRPSSAPMHLKKFAIARRARQHASRVRYPDSERYTTASTRSHHMQ
jgi:hypothetical protein